MIQGRFREGGKASEWEDQVEIVVSEDPVQPCQDRVWLAIGLGVKPIRKLDFRQLKALDGFVESIGECHTKLPIVLVSGAAHKIEVPQEDPGALNKSLGSEVAHTVQERY